MWSVSGPVLPVWIPGSQPKPQGKVHFLQWLLSHNSTSLPACRTPPALPLQGLLGYRLTGIRNLTTDVSPQQSHPALPTTNSSSFVNSHTGALLSPFIFLHLPVLTVFLPVFPTQSCSLCLYGLEIRYLSHPFLSRNSQPRRNRILLINSSCVRISWPRPFLMF